jgi:hypothetical protein
LDARWYAAYLHAQSLAEEDPEYDGDWVLLDRDEQNATFIQAGLAIEVSEQLFPDGHASSDLLQNTLGLVTIGFHSALEAFAVGHEVTNGRGSLPEAISRWLLRRAQPDLEAWVSDHLVACDATRHIVVHRRGIVDEAYAHRVKNNNYHVGERRSLDVSVVEKFAIAVWRTAVRIRNAV